MDLPEYDDWESMVNKDPVDVGENQILQAFQKINKDYTQQEKPFLLAKDAKYDTDTHVQVRCMSHLNFPIKPEQYYKRMSSFGLKIEKLNSSFAKREQI